MEKLVDGDRKDASEKKIITEKYDRPQRLPPGCLWSERKAQSTVCIQRPYGKVATEF